MPVIFRPVCLEITVVSTALELCCWVLTIYFKNYYCIAVCAILSFTYSVLILHFKVSQYTQSWKWPTMCHKLNENIQLYKHNPENYNWSFLTVILPQKHSSPSDEYHYPWCFARRWVSVLDNVLAMADCGIILKVTVPCDRVCKPSSARKH